MAALSIGDLDDGVLALLRRRAARHGRSVEAEIRAILTDAVTEPDPQQGLSTTLLDRFAELGGVDVTTPPRAARTRPVELPE